MNLKENLSSQCIIKISEIYFFFKMNDIVRNKWLKNKMIYKRLFIQHIKYKYDKDNFFFPDFFYEEGLNLLKLNTTSSILESLICFDKLNQDNEFAEGYMYKAISYQLLGYFDRALVELDIGIK